MYKRYWHHDSCETTEESISPLVTQGVEQLCSKQWKSGSGQIPWSSEKESINQRFLKPWDINKI